MCSKVKLFIYLLNILIITVFGCFSGHNNHIDESNTKIPITENVTTSNPIESNDSKYLINNEIDLSKKKNLNEMFVIQNQPRVANINDKNILIEKKIEEEQKEQEQQKQKQEQHEMFNNNLINSNVDDTTRLNLKFVEIYLKEFGYLKFNNETKINNENVRLISAIKTFQEFMGIYPPTGQMNLQTTETMLRKRCSNPDIDHNNFKHLQNIWDRSILRYYITVPNTNLNEWLPKGMKLNDIKELIHQAFSAWEIVISMDFVEEKNNKENADIIFELSNQKNNSLNFSGLGISSGGYPKKSQIWLDQTEKWSTFQIQEEDKIDIFLVLIHEIGHALGLGHSSDRNSVMYPIFEHDVGTQLPVISNDDVERLRMLYDPEESESNQITKIKSFISDGSPPKPSKCPSTLWTATQLLPDSDIFVFMDVSCWRFTKNRKLIDGPKTISEIFPNGPLYVDVAIASEKLIILIQERTLFGYTIDQITGKIEKVNGYPKQLQDRVLFYPEAGFPLANGSVILIRDNVFATFNPQENVATMLNDKNIFFPNIPCDIRSGFFASDPTKTTNNSLENPQIYWFFSSDSVTLYNFNLQKAIKTESLNEFLKCNQTQNNSQN